MMKAKILAGLLSLLVMITLLPACQSRASKKVVIYTSVDQVFSEPVLKKFEERTGIRVLPVYDVEAAKTTGMVNRLAAEKERPQADAFWSGEFAQTIFLKEDGVLAPYRSPNANDIPPQYVDKDGYWTGFAGRARVLMVNTNLVPATDYPMSIFDLLDDKWPAAQIGMAYPLFGTTATEAAAIYTALGASKGREFYQKLHDRGIRIVDGNSVVRDLVASGQLMVGLVDTDDAYGAKENGAPVEVIFLDQEGMGNLIIPNTVALVKGAPHPDEAKLLIDFLLSQEVTELLIASGWSHLPLRPVNFQSKYMPDTPVRGMSVNFEDVYQNMSLSKQDLTEIYIR